MLTQTAPMVIASIGSFLRRPTLPDGNTFLFPDFITPAQRRAEDLNKSHLKPSAGRYSQAQAGR